MATDLRIYTQIPPSDRREPRVKRPKVLPNCSGCRVLILQHLALAGRLLRAGMILIVYEYPETGTVPGKGQGLRRQLVNKFPSWVSGEVTGGAFIKLKKS